MGQHTIGRIILPYMVLGGCLRKELHERNRHESLYRPSRPGVPLHIAARIGLVPLSTNLALVGDSISTCLIRLDCSVRIYHLMFNKRLIDLTVLTPF